MLISTKQIIKLMAIAQEYRQLINQDSINSKDMPYDIQDRAYQKISELLIEINFQQSDKLIETIN